MYTFSPVTDRVRRLRERYRNTIVHLDAERTRIVTEFYKKSKNLPLIIKRAMCLYEVCKNMTVRVEDDELIVGNIATRYKGTTVWPEYSGLRWLYEELETGAFDRRYGQDEPMTLDQEDRDYFWQVKDFWAENCLTAKIDSFMPDGFDKIIDSDVMTWRKVGNADMPTGHLSPNYSKVIRKGFAAIKNEANEKLSMLEGNIGPDDGEKYLFYKAITIVCDAAILLAKRYSQECFRRSEEFSGKRKEELLKMGESLNHIMAYPCRTFHEAVQATFLYQVIMTLDGNLHGLSFGRFDQYTYDYLKADLESGRLTREEAQEIVDCFFIKVSDLYNARSRHVSEGTGGFSTFQHMTLGGVDKDGNDATNDVSYMMLEASARLKLHEPPLSLRINDNTPDKLWEAAILTSKNVGGIPCFQNDNVIIEALVRKGYALEDARDYCIIGCQEPGGSGNDYSASGGVHAKTAFNLANALLLAINNGINPYNGKEAGLKTGYLYEMESFDQVREAYKKQVEYFVNWQVSLNNYMENISIKEMPIPILSATIDGCMESGIDCTAGGAKYNSYGSSSCGMGTLADSLSAIKYMVFDKKLCTARELYDAIMANWEGYETLRQKIINTIPHYGNNDPYADELFRWGIEVYGDAVNRGYGKRGHFKPGLFTASTHIPLGRDAYATPDGRLAGTPLSDAISPVQGMDKKGPTAVLSSASVIEHEKFSNGTALNLKFHPNCVKSREDIMKLRQLIQVYFKKGGMHLQYNIIGADTLRAAQKNPEEYKDLVIRIAGFSAYFVELHKELQDDLIARTEHQI